MIHPTAIVHPGARIADGVEIGPYAVIGPNVEIGPGSRVGPHAVIAGHTRIGANNQIFQFVSLGEVPQDKKYAGEPTRVEIGIWSRPEGEVVLVPVTGTTKLMLNCKPSQTVATKGRGEAPRIRYSVHEPDSE